MEKRDLILRVGTLAWLAIVSVQLGAIWWELRTINREQLKSMYAVVPEETRLKLEDQAKRYTQGTLFDVRRTVQVEVDNQPLEVQVTR